MVGSMLGKQLKINYISQTDVSISNTFDKWLNGLLRVG